MATQLPETLQDIQDSIHALTSSDSTTPDEEDDQWIVRLRLINRAISNWERMDVLWRELYGTYTGSTIAANQTVYSLNEDSFRILGSLIRLNINGTTTYVDVIDPSDTARYANSAQRYAYITGNAADGFNLVISWVPAANDSLIGASIEFDYFKTADRLKSANDKPLMSNPDYITYWSAAQELLFNGRTNLAQNYLDEADKAMTNMKIQNELRPAYASNALVDVDIVRNNDAWGD